MSRIRDTGLEPLVAALASVDATRAEVIGVRTDLSKPDKIRALADATVAACGEGRQCASW